MDTKGQANIALADGCFDRSRIPPIYPWRLMTRYLVVDEGDAISLIRNRQLNGFSDCTVRLRRRGGSRIYVIHDRAVRYFLMRREGELVDLIRELPEFLARRRAEEVDDSINR